METILIIAVVVLCIIAWNLYQRVAEEQKTTRVYEDRWRTAAQEATELRDKEYQVDSQRATAIFEEFKAKEIKDITDTIQLRISTQYSIAFDRWKEQTEMEIRQDAIKRSRAVQHGKASEQLAPFYAGFPFDTRDTRFIGSPIDFIVFDRSAEKEKVTIYFMEVKTGKASLNEKQRLIKEAVLAKRIIWREWNPDN